MLTIKDAKASLGLIGFIALFSAPAALHAAVGVPNPAPTLPGQEVKSQGLDQTSGDVRWILPGPRALDPTVFGTPQAPLGFEPDVGVPVAGRQTNASGTAFTTTAGPTPFSNSFANINGGYELSASDTTLNDNPSSNDSLNFTATFTSPDGNTSYKVVVTDILPSGVLHPVFGGVGTNMIHHGITGIGTKLQPTAPTLAAFWGIGTLEVDGFVSEQGEDRLVHGMITCNVRNGNYELVFDAQVDCSKIHFHLFMPPFQIKGNNEVPSPVPTGFVLPNGQTQPFIHNMFENINLTGGGGTPVSGTVRDEFNSVSYNNNNGTVNWAGNWIENDAFGQGSGSGQVAIENGELTLEDQPNTGTQPSARREVNLAGTTSATLSFDFATTSGVDPNDSALVEVSNNGGSSWTTLETFTGISGSTSDSRNFDISGFIAGNTQVRFRVNANYGGSNELFLVDNVEIAFD